jgi:hypothetical protein
VTLEEKSRALEVRGSCLAKTRGRQKDYCRVFMDRCLSIMSPHATKTNVFPMRPDFWDILYVFSVDLVEY